MPDLSPYQSVELEGGGRIAWREWGAGKPLVLLHGWSMSSAVFAEVASLLSHHYRVLCPDLPGHGNSDPTDKSLLESYAAAVAEWLLVLGITDHSLLGWSLGGQVALCLAATATQLDNLLLVATTPRFCQSEDWDHGLPEVQVKSLVRNLGRAYEKTMGDFFQRQFTGERISPERIRQILKFAVRSGKLPVPEMAIDSLSILSDADLRCQLSRVDVRTLVQHGQLDQIIPCQAGEYLASNISCAEVVSMEGIGHAPFFSQPERSVDLWLDFLSGH